MFIRKGLLLDAFPMHFLLHSAETAPIVVVDSPSLRWLHFSTAKVNRTVIVLVKDQGRLEKMRMSIRNLHLGKVYFLRGDPESLPFRKRSIACFAMCSSDANKKIPTKIIKGAHSALTQAGCFLEVMKVSANHVQKEQGESIFGVKTFRYFVRPISGKVYFMTEHLLDWPFASFQIGILRRIYMAIDLLISKMGIQPLCNSVCAVVHPKTITTSVFDGWTKVIAENCFDKNCTEFKDKHVGFLIKVNRSVILVGTKKKCSDKQRIIVKFPLNNREARGLRLNARNITEINREGGAGVSVVLPRVVKQGELNGQQYFAETACIGANATKYWWKPGWRKKTVNAGSTFLIELHLSTKQEVIISNDSFNCLLGDDIAVMEKAARKLSPHFSLALLVEILCKRFSDERIVLVRSHGDFWSGNLLVSKTGLITGVVDWETSINHGFPLLDLLQLLVFQYKWKASMFFQSILTNKLMNKRFRAWEYKLIQHYCKLFGIQDDLWVGFVAIYWIKVVSFWIRTDYSENWLMRNGIKPFPKILKQVTAEYGSSNLG